MTQRSLADELRGWDDDALASLFADRPDLLAPVPADVSQLATRAGTRASAGRALDGLDRFTLQVLDGLVHLTEPVDTADLAALLGVDAATLAPALHRLRGLALLWGPPHELRLLTAVRELVGAPAGLGPPAQVALASYAPDRLRQLVEDAGLDATGDPNSAAEAVAGLLSDHDRMEVLLADCNDPTRRLLEELAWGPPVRRVEGVRADSRAADARSAVEWLVARGLLVVTGPDTVVVPREVAVHLRGGRLHASLEPDPPPLETAARDPGLVDRTAAGAAFTAVRAVENLLETWAVDGPPVLRAGGLGVRELRRAAFLLDVSEHTLALLAEVAYEAGLLAPSDDFDQVWAPTPAFDAWGHRPTEQRWVALVTAWLGTTRVPGLVGERDEKDRPYAALGRDLDRAPAPAVRRTALTALAGLPHGTAASAESITGALRWHRPRQGGRLRDRIVAWTLTEAETLGLTGRGALATPARQLLAGAAPDEAAEALEPLLPEPVDHVLLQADLTAVAPGPLTPSLARELSLAADVESTGGATVYRFTESSVRRALDAGRSAADLHALLAHHSTTPVPQPLTYLVDDVSRRHGHVRIGTAAAFVRCDDEAVLSQVLADRRAGQLRLHRLAPTVLAAQAPVDVVLDRLREMGLAPVAESATGDVVVARADERRAPARPRPPRLVETAPAPALLDAAVQALRAGERAASVPRRPEPGLQPAGPLPRTDVAQTLVALQTAAADRRSLCIGYVDDTGNATERVVDPVRVAGGRLTAYDHRTGHVRAFALHRVTGVAVLDDTAAR